MTMGIGIGGVSLMSGRRGTGGVLPLLISSPFNTTIEPGFGTHQAGDLLVCAASALSGTKPTVGGSWTEWGSEVLGSRSVSVFSIVASGPGTTITITGESGLRQGWVFRRAALDTINFSSAGSGTSLVWEAQPTMVANSLVGGYVLCNNTQTDLSAVLPSGMTERGSRDTAPAQLGFDTNGSYLSSFAPSNGTFDTASGGWIACAFSIKAV